MSLNDNINADILHLREWLNANKIDLEA